MSTDNEALVRRLWAHIWIDDGFDEVVNLVADPFVRHTRDGTTSTSPSGYAAHIQAATRTLRGTKVTFVDTASEGDMVFARLHLDAINLDSGNKLRLTWLIQHRVEAGRIAESWTLHQSGLDW